MQAHVPQSTCTADAAAMEQAFDWMVTLFSGSASAAEHEALQRWRAADARHEYAWQQLLNMQERLQAIPPRVASSALRAARQPAAGRRRALRVLAWSAGTGLIAYAGQAGMRQQGYLAELRTATGQRREHVLADGSRLMLDTASAVDLRFTGTERRVLLRAGAIHVQTAPEGGGMHRPFIVETPRGALQALGTRFTVRLGSGGKDRLEVFEGAVAISPQQGAGQRVDAGEWAEFDRNVAQVHALPPSENATWTRGLLVAERMPLGDLVAELARYRSGVLRCEAAVSGQIVSGVFSLEDTDAALSALQAALPVRIRYATRFWVTVSAA